MDNNLLKALLFKEDNRKSKVWDIEIFAKLSKPLFFSPPSLFLLSTSDFGTKSDAYTSATILKIFS